MLYSEASIFRTQTNKLSGAMKKNKIRQIKEDILVFDRLIKQNLLKTKLQVESKLVANTSLKILKEFEGFEKRAIIGKQN